MTYLKGNLVHNHFGLFIFMNVFGKMKVAKTIPLNERGPVGNKIVAPPSDYKRYLKVAWPLEDGISP